VRTMLQSHLHLTSKVIEQWSEDMRHSHRFRSGLALISTLAAASVILGSSLLSGAELQEASCELWKILENQGRSVSGSVDAECHGDVVNCFPFLGHSIPFGNWGVDSNLMAKQNSDQFAGWRSIDNQLQWNSCTAEFPSPDCDKYNSPDCTTQQAIDGARPYAWTLAARWTQTTCADLGFLNGMVVTSTGNFMDIWELDGCDEDENVTYMQFPDLNAVLSCNPDGHFCQGLGGWNSPTSVNPQNATAQVRLVGEAYTVQ
jgi:hypothetical protein